MAPTRLAQRPQLSEEVADHVRTRIMSGEVRPGDFIRLDETAAALGVSVTPVREAFYRSAPSLGTTLQVRPEQWPATRAEFDDYWREGVARIRFDEPVRRHLVGLTELRMLPQPATAVFGRVNKWITTGFLHREFRDELGLPWTPRDQRRFETFLTATAGLNRLLPTAVRTITYRVLLLDLRWRLRSGRPLM